MQQDTHAAYRRSLVTMAMRPCTASCCPGAAPSPSQGPTGAGRRQLWPFQNDTGASLGALGLLSVVLAKLGKSFVCVGVCVCGGSNYGTQVAFIAHVRAQTMAACRYAALYPIQQQLASSRGACLVLQTN